MRITGPPWATMIVHAATDAVERSVGVVAVELDRDVDRDVERDQLSRLQPVLRHDRTTRRAGM